VTRTATQMAALHARAFSRGGAWTRKDFEELLVARNMTICHHDHGFAVLRIVPPEAEILTIAIDPNHQGKGHGKALLSRLISIAKEARIKEIFLEVDNKNSIGRALYTSFGFNEIGFRKGYYQYKNGKCSDALMLAKTLNTN